MASHIVRNTKTLNHVSALYVVAEAGAELLISKKNSLSIVFENSKQTVQSTFILSPYFALHKHMQKTA
jgi:hypothetical protein